MRADRVALRCGVAPLPAGLADLHGRVCGAACAGCQGGRQRGSQQSLAEASHGVSLRVDRACAENGRGGAKVAQEGSSGGLLGVARHAERRSLRGAARGRRGRPRLLAARRRLGRGLARRRARRAGRRRRRPARRSSTPPTSTATGAASGTIGRCLRRRRAGAGSSSRRRWAARAARCRRVHAGELPGVDRRVAREPRRRHARPRAAALPADRRLLPARGVRGAAARSWPRARSAASA